jgi:hypothetical protein
VKLEVRGILPRDPTVFSGLRSVRVITAVYMVVIVVRSCIHLFTPDGGAQSIAGIDTSVAGGDNIIAIFHQWGATQLLLVAVLIVLFFRYPGLTPLIVLTLAAEGIMRMIASHIMPVTTEGTPPGAALNWPVFGFVVVLFLLSLMERRR